jgi:hypothetical protein
MLTRLLGGVSGSLGGASGSLGEGSTDGTQFS